MKILNKIKIGIYEYSVVESDEPIILDKKLCAGLIDYDNLVITIKKDMPEDKKQQTLIHEIMHGIVREWGVDLECNNEEAKIDWIATGLTQVIKDNPNMFANVFGKEQSVSCKLKTTINIDTDKLINTIEEHIKNGLATLKS